MTTDNNALVSADRLLDAVDQLTLERTIYTTITDDNGGFVRIHSEKHPPLLTLLLEGTGQGKVGRNSDIRIPIDADALEMWGQVRDLIKLWARQLDTTFDQADLNRSIRNWYLGHSNAHRANKISDSIDHDVTRMVEGWVRMIENKFDPPEKREWKDACPNRVETRNIEGTVIGSHRCGARRVVVNGEERFAIHLNVTLLVAECARCHAKWVGERGIMTLRYETNLCAIEREEAEADRMAELERLANGLIRDTPTEGIAAS